MLSMQPVFVAGTGMTRSGKHIDCGLKSLTAEAIGEAIADAGITRPNCRRPTCATPLLVSWPTRC